MSTEVKTPKLRHHDAKHPWRARVVEGLNVGCGCLPREDSGGYGVAQPAESSRRRTAVTRVGIGTSSWKEPAVDLDERHQSGMSGAAPSRRSHRLPDLTLMMSRIVG